MRYPGLTLVEVPVVAGIIAVIVAVAAPTIERERSAALVAAQTPTKDFLDWNTLSSPEQSPDGRKSHIVRAHGSGPIEERCTYEVWQGTDSSDYHCHGWAFGHFQTPHGTFSLCTGHNVTRYVQNHFNPVTSHADVCKGTIIVWKDERDYIIHSAIVSQAVVVKGTLDATQTTVVTKNGDRALDVMTLQDVHEVYQKESSSAQYFFCTPK
jgi:hypothetical protein